VPVDPALYRRHRLPPEIISQAIWLSYRFNLSHRDVEELLGERGIRVSYEAIRLWCRRFGPAYAEQLREQAAVAFLRRVLAAAGGTPRVIITDKLASYVPAVKRVLPTTEHRRHKRLNNRAENSHLPVRKRERVLQRFKSPQHAQSFLEPFSAVCNQFRPRRHRLSAHHYREIMRDRFHTWQEVVGAPCP
jgi:putative transposase